MANKQSYFDYYNRAIESQTNGIKLVLGGTGLGKTSSIVEVIQHGDTGDRKFIYCANRLQLLNEMAEKLEESGISYAYLRSNTDIVIKIITTPKLRDGLFDLIDSHGFRQIIDHVNLGWRKLDPASLRAACTTIQRIGESLKGIRGDVLENLIDNQVQIIISFFRTILQEVKTDIRMHRELTNHHIIRELFPYITFAYEDNTQVLLVTIQKAYLGFFDGQENINLTKLNGHNGNNIIFLDEYDFLENELIGLICKSEQVSRPFRFVEFFYNAMNRHKLPAIEYPILPGSTSDLRQRLENIMGIIETLRSEGIRFPDINQFTSQLEDKNGFIFQTSRSLIMDNLYLKQTERSFEIVREKADGNIHALRLFRLVRSAMTQIMFLFKELEIQYPTIYQELLRQCYQDTDYYRLVGRITQLPRQSNLQTTRLDNLLEEGYGLYEVSELNQATDPDEVEFNYLSIYTTPERVLSSLARNNLVFGLSATADIPRLVRNFNEDWIRKQVGVRYFETDETDIEIIVALNQAKQGKLTNDIQVVRSKSLDEYQRNDIRDFISAVAKDHEFGGDDKRGIRRGRLESFFSTLLWILENRNDQERQNDTHLIFLSTFRQIKHIFNKRDRLNGQLFNISPLNEDALFNIYRMNFERTEFIIVFYDAEQAKYVQNDAKAKEAYDRIFWEGLPVITVTQYTSAGNGVNLQYFLTEQHKQDDIETDYRNIHLIEAPYFYFSRRDTNLTIAENNAIVKENIWYLAKLYEGQIISRDDFEKSLRRIHFDDLNSKYHNEWGTKGHEAIYNRLAALIQALGRIERVWHKMPNQNVVLGKDVWNIFQLFCTRPQFAEMLAKRMPIVSSNLQSIFRQIEAQSAKDEKWIRRYKEEGLASKNAKCKAQVGGLLQRLSAFRSGNEDAGAKQDWLQLRRAALHHDLHSSILKDYSCLFKAEYNHYRNNSLYVDENLDILPYDRPYGDNVRQWHLDAVYEHVALNPILRRFFEQRGYELGFNSVSQLFFTPYFYQAVLVGAIGEAAIEAILIHLGIELDAAIPDPLFELADLKIEGQAWYIDCKNYSDRTLDNFHVLPDDPAWRPKLNDDDFVLLAQHKLAALAKFHRNSSDTKLIYINLASADDWKLVYFDASFREVRTFKDAKIVVVPGMLRRENAHEYTDAFRTFIDHLSTTLGQENL